MSENNDGLELVENGTAVIEFSGIIRTLKRPTLGQYRGIIETLGDFRKDILKATADGATIDMSDQLDMLVIWLDGVLAELAGEGFPRKTVVGDDGTEKQVIDEDKLAPWLLSGEVVTDLITHWQTVPSRRGGQ